MSDKVDNPTTKKKRRNWKTPFLAALKNHHNVRAACEAAGIGRAAVYKEYHANAKFADQWDEATQQAVDILEARAWERSKTSDQVLMFLLKAHRREIYGDHVKNEITGANGQDLFNHAVIDNLLAGRPSGNPEQ